MRRVYVIKGVIQCVEYLAAFYPKTALIAKHLNINRSNVSRGKYDVMETRQVDDTPTFRCHAYNIDEVRIENNILSHIVVVGIN
jgi:hypothetical protein